jgi:hypothetical protein
MPDVSLTPHRRCIWCHLLCMHHACDVIDTACMLHAVSLTPHAHKKFRTTSWCMRCKWHRVQNMTLHAQSMNDSNGPGSLWMYKKNKCSWIVLNCPTPPWKKYINLKGLPNKNVVHAVSLTPHSRLLRLKIDHILANSKQNLKRL